MRKDRLTLLRDSLGTVALVCGVTSSSYAQIPCQYELAAVVQAPACPIVGPPPTVPAGISPNGRYICGFYYFCFSAGYRAFVLDTKTGKFLTLPFPPGVVSATAADVSNNGLVVGQYETTTTEPPGYRGFVYDITTSEYTQLDPLPGGAWSAANGINSAGVVCGFRSIGPGVNPYQAFIWSPDLGFLDLGVMNGPNSSASRISDSGIVVGWTGSAGTTANNSVRAFIYDGDVLVLGPVPAGINNLAEDVTTEGVVLVRGKLSSTISRTFLYEDGRFGEVPVPADFDRTFGAALNDSLLIVGAVSHSSIPSQFHACVWFGGSVNLLENLIDTTLPAPCSNLAWP